VFLCTDGSCGNCISRPFEYQPGTGNDVITFDQTYRSIAIPNAGSLAIDACGSGPFDCVGPIASCTGPADFTGFTQLVIFTDTGPQ
jgi:hypothetical protein